MSDVDKIVLLHGVWSHGAAMTLMKRYLEKEYGFDVRVFNYRSVQRSLDENADALAAFILDNEIADTHLVGHSLGGVILMRMLANESVSIGGRVVCLGSPLRGSRSANVLDTIEWGDIILGKSVSAGVVRNTVSEWGEAVCEIYDVGTIAGDVPYGVGQMFANFEGPNDGTVAVAETILDGQTDHIILPTSHSGLVFTSPAADQVAAFLRHGEFSHDISNS